MADHLDFIQIRGLESSTDEVFRGVGGDEFSISGGIESNPQSSEEVPDYGDLFERLWGWISGQSAEPDPDAESRSLSRGVPAIAGSLLPDILRYSPPAVLYKATETALITIVDEVIEHELDTLSWNSERNNLQRIKDILNDIDDHLKKALIWEDGILGIDKSILGTALMEEEASLVKIGIDELKAAIDTLKYNDEEIVIGDLHAYLRNKIVEY